MFRLSRRALAIVMAGLLAIVGLPATPALAAGVIVDELGGLAVNEAGSTTDTFTVVLTSAPTATVTVSLNVSDGQTLISNGGPFSTSTSVTFDNADWFTPKTITVQAVDDAVAEGSPHTGAVTLSSSSADVNYNGITINSATADITDNDFAGVTVNTGGTVDVDETGPTTDTFTVELDTPPTATVTVTVNGGSQVQVSSDNSTFASTATFTFDNTSWNSPQTVYVQAVDDAVDEASPHIVTVTLSASSTDNQYNGISIPNVLANVTDNDTAGVVVAQSGGSTDVDETGPTTDTFTVVLTSQPATLVNVTVTADAQEQVSKNGTTFSGSITLNFTAANWSTPQTVTVRAVDDAVDEPSPHTGTVTLSASGDATYVALNPLPSITVNITDNDAAGVTVSPTTVNVTEGGATGSFSIVLTSQPTSDVTISFSNVNGQLQPIANVTFTTGNWNIAKTITVTAVDDGAVEGAHADTIQMSASSGDANYNGFTVPDVTANITDNDSFAVIVTESGGSTNVAEGGATDTFSLVLGSQPSADVVISFNTGTQLLPIANVTFTSADWNTAKTITVTAVDDGAVEGAHTGTVTMTIAGGGDPNFVTNPSNVVANITDNDTAGFTLNRTSGLTTTEPGGTDTFTVRLNTQPTQTVTIALSSSNPAEGTVNPTTLTFQPNATALNPQTVTVTGVDDAVADGNVAYTIVTGPATSTDPNYSNLNPPDVAVTNADNETQPSLSIGDVPIVEGNSGTTTATFTVSLTPPSSVPVTVQFTTADGPATTANNDYVRATGTLTFTTGQTTKTIAVTVNGDTTVEPDETFFVNLSGATNATSPTTRG